MDPSFGRRPCWWDLQGIGSWDGSVRGRELERKLSGLVGQILLRAWRGLSANGSLVSRSTASKPSISHGHDCIKLIASSFVGLDGPDELHGPGGLGPNGPDGPEGPAGPTGPNSERTLAKAGQASGQ